MFCVSPSTGMIITSSGMSQNIQVWPMWDFPTISFGSRTFCCTTGRHCEDRPAGCCSVIWYAWCQTQLARIVLHTVWQGGSRRDDSNLGVWLLKKRDCYLVTECNILLHTTGLIWQLWHMKGYLFWLCNIQEICIFLYCELHRASCKNHPT